VSADFLHPVIRDVFAVHFPVASAPGACHCGGTGRVCDHPCNRCTKEPTMIEDTKATKDNVLDRLRAEKERVQEQRDALERRIEEIDAALCEAGGDDLAAEWHRLRAQGHSDAAHVAWVRMMADSALRQGRDPAEWITNDAPKRAAEVRAEVERLRAESGAATT